MDGPPSGLCTNTGVESFTTDGFVYCTQLEASPRAHHLLPQICDVLYWRVVDSFVHHSPNAVINRCNVRAVEWPHVRSSEFTTKQLHCVTCTA